MPTPIPANEKVTALSLRRRKVGGAQAAHPTMSMTAKIAAITAYDVSFARLADGAGLDVILVGDSLGMVVQGHPNTLPVTLDDVVYHTRLVARGVTRAHLVADLPFMSYQVSIAQGVAAAGRLIKEGGAEAVKIEGGDDDTCALTRRLTDIGIPVMGHVGMTPQSVHKLGGFKVQGRDRDLGDRIATQAAALARAGAYAIVLESIPADLGAKISREIPVPTIGIGAGRDCDGQILVMHDVLGLDPHWQPRFARRFAEVGRAAQDAFAAYAAAVRGGQFPSDDETFK